MKTLTVVDGDLRVGGRGFSVTTGVQKTVQDMGLALRESFGIDRFHPQWGSLLPDFIGGVADEFAQQRIESEVRRVVSNYIAVQQENLARIRETGQHHTPARMSELLAEVESIEVDARGFGSFQVTIILRTVDARRFSLTTAI